jgi:hypothetical protein
LLTLAEGTTTAFMERLLVTPPQIGRLLGRGRKWASRQVDAKRFGPVVHRRGRWQYVSLAAVAHYHGRPFTPEQLRAAGIRQPNMEQT